MVLGSKGIGDEILPSYVGITLPETNSLHLKVDGWNIIVSFWGPAYFQGRTVSFREGILPSYVGIISQTIISIPIK